MGIVVVAAVVALVAALLAGGHLTAVESLPFRVGVLLGAALFCQVAGVFLGHVGLPAGPTYAFACLASAVLLVMAVRNDGVLAGNELIAAGLFLNALVMGVNANMPVSQHAVARAGAAPSVGSDIRHEPETASTRLRFLGAVIPVPLPLRPEVNSVGGLLVASGMAQLVFGAVRPYGRRPREQVSAGVGAKQLSRSDRAAWTRANP